MRERALEQVPGVVVLVLGAALALTVAQLVPTVSALVVAVLVGALVRNLGLLSPAAVAGAGRLGTRCLRLGVVLLGLQLSVPAVLELGRVGLLVIAATVLATFAATLGLGRLLRVPRLLTLLVATGFAICGAAAVAAMSAVADPDGDQEEDTATAVALVTLYGTLALIVLPPLVPVLGLDDHGAGLWIGASVHEVAQVVAAGGAVSVTALAVATVTKLGRVVLLAPLVAAYGLVVRVRERSAVRTSAVPDRAVGPADAPDVRPPLLPLFVVGFLAAVAVRSAGLLPDGVLDLAQVVTTALLAAAMVGLGVGVDLRHLLRTGGRAGVLAAASTVVAAGVSGALVVALV